MTKLLEITLEMRVNFSKWMERYKRIAELLEIDVEMDRLSTRLLSEIVGDNYVDRKELEWLIAGKVVVVIGFGEALPLELEQLRAYRHLLGSAVVIVADKAVSEALERGIFPDIVVSDLDGDLNALLSASARGSIVVVHGHGDNVEKLERVVPRLLELRARVHPTTQVEPLWNVFNYGGFTDGDRAIYLATSYEPSRVLLVGMDFSYSIDKRVIDRYYSDGLKHYRKLVKLEIARELVEELACSLPKPIYTLSRVGVRCVIEVSSEHVPLIVREWGR